MRGGWKIGVGLLFGDSACGGAGVFAQICAAKDVSAGCVYEEKFEEDGDFHMFDGVKFYGKMSIGHMLVSTMFLRGTCI